MNKLMKVGIAGFFMLATLSTNAQSAAQQLPAFSRIITSPHVSMVLVEGNQESIRLQYEQIAPEKVNVSVRHRTLHIYLDDARITVKNQKWEEGNQTYKRPIYDREVKVIAYVTYKQLNELQVRGEEAVTCQTNLVSDAFRLRVYGQATVNLAGLTTEKLKVKLYGENKVTIQSGRATRQRYRIYGENRLNTENLTGETVSAHSYGESHLSVYASDRIGVTAFGESDIRFAGGAQLRKGLVIGGVTIHRAD